MDFIVIAPEYNLPDQQARATTTRRPSTPPSNSRCATPGSATRSTPTGSTLAGQLAGADMAWDLGLAHPDLFAGDRRRSPGFPAKYVYKYKPQAEKPAALRRPRRARPRRPRAGLRPVRPADDRGQPGRGLRRLLQARPRGDPRGGPFAFFDWIDRAASRPRPPGLSRPSTARDGDARFFGVVVPRDRPRPGLTCPRGRRTPSARTSSRPRSRMRTSVQPPTLINLITAEGINRLDVWLSPRSSIDFKKQGRGQASTKSRSIYKATPPGRLSPTSSKTSGAGATASRSTTSRSSTGNNPKPKPR